MAAAALRFDRITLIETVINRGGGTCAGQISAARLLWSAFAIKRKRCWRKNQSTLKRGEERKGGGEVVVGELVVASLCVCTPKTWAGEHGQWRRPLIYSFFLFPSLSEGFGVGLFKL